MPTKTLTVAERFMGKVHQCDVTGCWLWKGFTEKNGYGRFGLNGRMAWAHRVAYQLFVAEIPDGLELDHKCRTPNCVNPHHLEAVTHKENMRRSPIGAPATHRAKTHCPKGHEYAGDNLIIYRNMRYCRQCGRDHKRAYKQRKQGGSI